MRLNFVKTAKRIVRRFVKRPIGQSILLYHRIAIAKFDPFNNAVQPDQFERQLARLRTKTVLPLVEFTNLHAQGRLPKDALAITFDDGYACNAVTAAPMLNSLGMPATFFVVADAISRSEEFWWDQLEAIVQAPGFDFRTASRVLASRSVSELSTQTNSGNLLVDIYLRLWRGLRDLSAEERRACLDDLRDQMKLENAIRPTHRPMTPAELRTIAANPLFEIGGHTVTHPALSTRLPAEQKHEIISGAHFLEATVGTRARCFAYPFGDLGRVTRDIVKAAGFVCAVTTEPRRVRAGDDLFTLPRRQALNGMHLA
jgi:peptidoglycan/xylan/chitin deacetylase (PgdA/CDA1 family)